MSNLDPVVKFGDWNYQVIYGQLWPVDLPMNTDQKIRLEPRLHSLLNYFLQHPNILLAKDTLIEKVWPSDEGTDAAVMRAVGALRKILGDDVRTPRYIATVSKKGYCWLAACTSVTLIPDEADDTAAETDDIKFEPATKTVSNKDSRQQWPFIVGSATAILLSCASIAYILAKFTAAPLLKLPDTITPISALSGQEYWPLLNAEQSKVLFQHRSPGQPYLNWSVQNLTDMRVTHLAEQYSELSQALWLDEQQILFRGKTVTEPCSFYRQQILPIASEPQKMWPCQQVYAQGSTQWQQQWLYLDAEHDSEALLWQAKPDAAPSLLKRLPHAWRKLQQILVSDDDVLFMLAQETQHNSILLKLTLPDGEPELVKRFAYTVKQFSWWADSQLLLAPHSQQLQILDLDSGELQGLGPLTRMLTQTVRYPGQLLATQYLDYTTDIFLQTSETGQLDEAALQPWHISNRSERLVSQSDSGIAFVSERGGHSQIWLAQGRDSVQVSQLSEDQQIQQLLWHKGNLLAKISMQLYQVDLASGKLTPFADTIANAGRFASCEQKLYWTELTEHGWQLFSLQPEGKQLLTNDVVDVRCAPSQALVLQYANKPALGLMQQNGDISELPVAINWRELNAEQWFVDGSGIYWLDKARRVIAGYGWQQQVVPYPWLKALLPEAIYSSGQGLGYVVQPRPYDTDIVWLQNRR